MNRKTKTIIFWIIAGLLIAIFAFMLFFGAVNTFFGPGTKQYIEIGSVLSGIGVNKSDIFTYSPFVCIAAGIILCIMFYQRYNTRIN